MFINFLIQKDFLNTCFRQWSFLLTNQNAHLITNEPIKFRVRKVKICGHRQRASESRVNESNISWYQLWILLNLREKCLKFGENRRNVQKIFDSVRKELQDECHCAWSLLKITWTSPIWQSEKMVEKLNRSSCLVRFCWFGIVWNHSTSSGSRLLRLLLVPTEEFSDRLVDSGQMRSVWSCSERNFHSCGLTARVFFYKPASDHSVIAVALRQWLG